MRTGDTPADERRRLVRNPPDLLITTPESLYLMLTSAARETLRGVEAVIIDEIHALAATKRGAHLALTLERLEAVAERPPQRIGLSATQRPLDEIARFLGGPTRADGERRPRPVTIVDAGVRKPLEIEVVVPVEDMGALGEIIDEPVERPGRGRPGAPLASGRPSTPGCSSWSSSTAPRIVFVNARRLAERLATRLNELAPRGREPGGRGRGHARPSRATSWSRPTTARCRGSAGCRSRTSSSGASSRAWSPPARSSSASTWARSTSSSRSSRRARWPRACSASVGPATRWASRAGASSSPSTAPTCVEAAVVVRAHARRADRAHPLPAQPARRAGPADRGHVRARRVAGRRPGRRGAPRRATTPSCPTRCCTTCSTCSPGRYPSDEFGELRPRIVWDRVDGTVRGRAGAQRLAVTSGGTIPDRGPVRRVPARRHPGGRARRGDGLREPAGRDLPARRDAPGASRTSPTSGSSSPRRPGQPGQDAVLARRRPGPAARAGPGHRRVRPRDPGRAGAEARSTRLQRDHGLDAAGRRQPASPTSTSRPRPPARCPTTAPSWSSASATRSATGGSACSRRSAPRCTRRGPWRCRPGWPSGGASTSS